MKVAVYDVAAESGGAMVVLKEFYHDVVNCNRDDIHWFFLVSQDVLEERKNISVLRFPHVKRSWLHRLRFEQNELKRVLKRINPDLLLSLQNMPIVGCRCPQYVYLQQSLQFCPKRFSFLRREEREMALRQTLIGSMIRHRLPKAEQIFVQTRWMREATCRWISCSEERVHVVPVVLTRENVSVLVPPYEGQQSREFFYPARAETYKNHKVILEACRVLLSKGEKDFRIVLTVDPESSAFAKHLCAQIAELPIDCVGTLPYEEVWEYYSKTILLFPSYLETCGLPLLEARLAGARIIASDMPFAHEALDGYPNTEFFPYQDVQHLSECMLRALNEPRYVSKDFEKRSDEDNLMARMLYVFEEKNT